MTGQLPTKVAANEAGSSSTAPGCQVARAQAGRGASTTNSARSGRPPDRHRTTQQRRLGSGSGPCSDGTAPARFDRETALQAVGVSDDQARQPFAASTGDRLVATGTVDHHGERTIDRM